MWNYNYGSFFSAAAKNTANVIGSLASPATVATVAAICHEGIQKSRRMPASDLKDTIKDQFSYASSAVNAFMIGSSFWELMLTLLTHDTWRKLDNKQRLFIITSLLLSAGGAGYALSRFGIEENVLAAGGSALASTLFINTAKLVAQHFAQKYETEPSLGKTEPSGYQYTPL